MSITSFFALVELRTKIASILPFAFGSLYAIYAFDTFNLFHAVIMFSIILLFHMSTSALNHYMKYKTSTVQEDQEIHNVIQHHQLNPTLLKHIIIFMFVIISLLGLYLTYLTNIIVLLLGIICFTISILYSLAPLPISRTPLSELFFGVTLGFTLTFISIYIHAFCTDLLELQFRENQMLIRYNLQSLIGILFVCMPLIITISNIMLANNICDIEEDLLNNRYTLPIYIGKEKALMLWEFSYYVVYILILITILTKHLPWICIASLITFVPVKHHIEHFKLKQIKSETFGNAIQNCFLISISLILSLGLDVFANYLFL